MGSAAINYITQEEYLNSERWAAQKHEYYKGEVFAMSGASIKHNTISTNCIALLANKLKGKNCRPFGSDLRIHIPANTLYTYPDISIICGEVLTTDDKFDTATNPTVSFEILSNSTRNYDKGIKFTLYREIPTLLEYILIDSEAIMVEKFSKNKDNSWTFTEFKAIDMKIRIETINEEITLSDIYTDINFT